MSNYRKDFRDSERDYYWSVPRIFLMSVFALLFIGATLFTLNYFGVASFGYFATKYEAIRRDQMIESRSYTEGTIRELYTLKRQYGAATTDAERATIVAAARHEFSIFPRERLPNDLVVWLDQLGG